MLSPVQLCFHSWTCGLHVCHSIVKYQESVACQTDDGCQPRACLVFSSSLVFPSTFVCFCFFFFSSPFSSATRSFSLLSSPVYLFILNNQNTVSKHGRVRHEPGQETWWSHTHSPHLQRQISFQHTDTVLIHPCSKCDVLRGCSTFKAIHQMQLLSFCSLI